MDVSFYTAGVGAKAQQTKLDIIGNNMANANTVGYKSQSAGFIDLLYSNMREAADVNTQLKTGAGARVEKTDINFNNGGLSTTGNSTDYCIINSGFFAVQNPETNEVFYTRDGSFKRSLFEDGEFYLVTGTGNLVLDENMERIRLDLSPDQTEEDGEDVEVQSETMPGVFDFQITDGMLLVGDNLFSPTPKNGEPILKEDAVLQQSCLELSNVEVSVEMVKLIEAQRAFSMNLKMVQTSNEIEQTIDGLRA